MSRMATIDAFLNTRSKKALQISFCRTCPTRVKNAGQRIQTSMLSRRLAVRGEKCLFWPLS